MTALDRALAGKVTMNRSGPGLVAALAAVLVLVLALVTGAPAGDADLPADTGAGAEGGVVQPASPAAKASAAANTLQRSFPTSPAFPFPVGRSCRGCLKTQN